MRDSDLRNEGQADELDQASYVVLLQAAVDSRMEGDKSLLALASGGIALVATLVTRDAVRADWQLMIYSLAALCFIATMFACLEIFRRNPDHLRDVIRGKRDDDARLVRFDRVARASFLVGAVLTSVAAVTSG